MKTLFSSLFALGSIVLVQAQKIDAKAGQILDAVTKKYKSNKNTYFKFAYGTGQNGKITKKETGIFYTTPTQYKLKIMGVEQIFDGNKVYNISAEDSEVTIAKANGNEMAFSPTSYLNSYKKDYNTSYVGKKNINGKNVDLVRLTPIKNNGIKEVSIYIDTKNQQVERIDQTSLDNSYTTITIQDYKANQKLNSDMFSFNKNQYKNYIITEL